MRTATPATRARARARSTARSARPPTARGRGRLDRVRRRSSVEGIGCGPSRTTVRWRPWGSSSDIVAHLEPRSGPSSGEPAPLEGGITNRNFRATLGGGEYVIRRHGKDTEPAGDRPRGRAAGERDRRRAGHRAGGRGELRGWPGDRVRALRGGRLAASCADARARRSRARCARFHDSGVSLPATLLGARPARRDYARDRAERGGALPRGLRAGAWRSPRASPPRPARGGRRVPATTTCCPATSSAPARTAGS